MVPGEDNKATTTPLVIPTILPCTILPGRTTVSKQLWKPQVTKNTNKDCTKTVTAYFRGRRLVGREIPLPDGFIGVIPDNIILKAGRENAKKRRRPESAPDIDGDKEEEEEEEEEEERNKDEDKEIRTRKVQLPKLKPMYTFKKIRVLGHEESPAYNAPHIMAMREWTNLASAIHR